MKARIEDEKIKQYPVLPTVWKNYMNFRAASTELLESEGFFDVVVPDSDPRTERLGQIFFDNENRYFTFPIEPILLPTLEERKQTLLRQFEVVQDDFERLISRCERIHGKDHEGLNTAISETLAMQSQTVTAINALPIIEAAMAFSIRAEDIEFYKAKFDPYKF